MKLIFFITYVLWISPVVLSQEIWSKIHETHFDEIVINGDGLDDLIIKNSKDKFIRILLRTERKGEYSIITKSLQDQEVFYFQVKKDTYRFNNKKVFRKYITNRISNTSAIIEIPKDKSVVVNGKNIGVNSYSYIGNLHIAIHRGNIYLNTVEGFYKVDFFQGNLYVNNSEFRKELYSNKGIIMFEGERVNSLFKKQIEEKERQLFVNSVLGNIFVNGI